MNEDYPRRINIGSGRKFQEDFLNLDVNSALEPDFVWDLNSAVPDGLEVRTRRFGRITIRHGEFEEIVAEHVLEHIRELATAMTSCLNLLKTGGVMRISVPYDLSHGAWQDPTHVRAFNERTFRYFSDNSRYLGWTEHRFDVDDLTLRLTAAGLDLHKQGRTLDEIAAVPRAVSDILAVLRKRPLTEAEKTGPHPD